MISRVTAITRRIAPKVKSCTINAAAMGEIAASPAGTKEEPCEKSKERRNIRPSAIKKEYKEVLETLAEHKRPSGKKPCAAAEQAGTLARGSVVQR